MENQNKVVMEYAATGDYDENNNFNGIYAVHKYINPSLEDLHSLASELLKDSYIIATKIKESVEAKGGTVSIDEIMDNIADMAKTCLERHNKNAYDKTWFDEANGIDDIFEFMENKDKEFMENKDKEFKKEWGISE